MLIADSRQMNPLVVLGHERIASPICFADVTVHALPAFLAFTELDIVMPRFAVIAICQRTAQRLRTVVSAESGRTRTFAIIFVAAGKLRTAVRLDVAVEARGTWGALIGATTEDRELVLHDGGGTRNVPVSRGNPRKAQEAKRCSGGGGGDGGSHGEMPGDGGDPIGGLVGVFALKRAFERGG
jgi:hypothetical protein